MRKTLPVAFFGILLLLLPAACGGSGPASSPPASATAAPPATSLPAAPTATPLPPTMAPAPTAAPLSTAVPTPTLLPLQASTVLDAIAAAMAAAGSWQVEGQLGVKETPDADGAVLITSISAAHSAKGDSMLVTTSQVTLGLIQGGAAAESRVVGGTRFRRDPNTGEWSELPAAQARPSLTVDAGVVGRIDAGTARVEVTMLDGERVYHVTGTVPGEAAAETAEVWAATLGFRLRRIALQGTAPVENFGGLLPSLSGDLSQRVEAVYSAFGAPIDVRAPSPEPAPAESSLGPMARYRSPLFPFTMAYPAEWRQEPRVAITAVSFIGPGNSLLSVGEELLPLPTSIDDEPSLDAYVLLVLRHLEETVDGFELVSVTPRLVGDRGREARVIELTGEDGSLRWARLVYVHDGLVGFSATYGAAAEQFDGLREMIELSFLSFEAEG